MSPPNDSAAADVSVAIRNGFVLGASLVAGWSVALVVRFLILPRLLAPARFGALSFADAFAAVCAVALGFGVDMYVQKEIPKRPSHASDFLGGILLARVLLAGVVLIGMALVVSNRSAEVRHTVLVFGVAQLVSTNANTFASVLHAVRTVGRLAMLNVVTKLVWAAGVAATILAHRGLEFFALAFLVSELLRAVLLWRVVRRHLRIELRLDLGALGRTLAASLPYYVNAAAIAIYARLAINIMAGIASEDEVGWYSAATNITAIAMLLSPLMNWVLMPQLARAARETSELLRMFRRSLELVVSLALPVSLALGLCAEECVGYVFGAAYEPSIASMRVIAPTFVLTYVAMLSSACLILLGRGWTNTWIALVSLGINAILSATLIGPALRHFGPGGAGIGAAGVVVFTELLVASVMLMLIGRDAFDRRNLSVMGGSLAGGLVALGVHVAATLAGLGALRLVLDLVAYFGFVFATGALRGDEIVRAVRAALVQRGQDAQSTV